MDFNYGDSNAHAMPLFQDNNFMYNMDHTDHTNVLDPSDQGYLDNFFANPNSTAPIDLHSGGPSVMDAKDGRGAEGNMPAYRMPAQPQTVNPAVTYAGMTPTMYSPYADGGHGAAPVGHQPHPHAHGNVWGTHAQPGMNTDSAAANSLVNLAKTTPQQTPQTSAFTHDAHPAMSWGNFSATPHPLNQQLGMGYPGQQYGMHSPATMHTPGFSVPHFPPRHHSISYTTEHPHYPGVSLPQQQVPSLAQPTALRARHMSIGGNLPDTRQPTGLPGAHTLPDPSRSPAVPSRFLDRPQVPVRFGSDDNFGSAGYRNPTDRTIKHDKSGNLLNAFGLALPLPGLPGVPAQPYQPPRSAHGNGQARSAQSSPSTIGGLPVASPSANKQGKGSWGQQSDGQQAGRKRRRQDDGDDEYVPNAATLRNTTKRFRGEPSDDDDEEPEQKSIAVKRRKSTAQRVAASEDGASPDGGDDADDDAECGGARTGSARKARREKANKPRENLSESQKRYNHIMSEKKRRDIINQGYADLNRLVPNLSQGKSGMSRSESLSEVASYLESLVNGTKTIMDKLNLPYDDDLSSVLAAQPKLKTSKRYFGEGDFE